jgi:hypothetical protein
LEEKPEEFRGLRRRDQCVPLWGELSPQTRGRGGAPDEWIELRIPHRLRYPVPAPNCRYAGVKAHVTVWENDRGEVQFVQLRDLKPYDLDQAQV